MDRGDGGGDEDSREAVERVVLASAPERENELRALWQIYAHHFCRVDDREGVTLDAGAFGIVRFSHRTMLEFWLLSFASWKAFETFMALIALMQLATGRIELVAAELAELPGQDDAEAAYKSAIDRVRDLYCATYVHEFEWPAGVPRPGADAALKSEIDVAAFELCVIATGFAFLHESHHVTLAVDGSAPLSPPEEELACDRFARQMLFDGVDRYSAEAGYAPSDVLEKRAFGAALNTYFVLVLTPVERWSGSVSHPPVAQRFRELANDLSGIPENSKFWLLLSSLLVAHLKLEKRLPPKLAAAHFRDLCYELFDVIDAQSTDE